MMKKLLLLLLALNLTVLITQAQTTTEWTNGIGNQAWNEAGNWDNGVPDATKLALIQITPGPIISSPGALAKNIDMNSPGELFIQATGTVTVSGASGCNGGEDNCGWYSG